MSVSDEILAAVTREALIVPGAAVIVLLSGGRDSTCLLHVGAAVAGPQNVTALHVNYGLRETAGRDEQACIELAAQTGTQITIIQAPQRPAVGNLQSWARDVRYGVASGLALRTGAAVASGHTRTDQLETILYRLISSPSRRALLGMRARDGRLLRPLLRFTREQTERYCQENGLSWVDDETNDSDAYVRNRIRNELVPLLRELHPAAEANILALAETLADEQAVLDGLVNDELIQGGAAITLARLQEQPRALARMIVQRLADQAHGGPAPGVARRLPEILALKGHGTAHLDLPHRLRASVSDGLLRFGPTDRKRRDR